jgi:mono/diheme cytochrome c family protein
VCIVLPKNLHLNNIFANQGFLKMLRTITLIFFLSAASLSVYAETTQNTDGKDLFWEHCAKCHKIGKELTGPDLSHIRDRRTIDWLIPFIQNSQKVINSGNDPIANQLYSDYKKVEMPDNKLSKEEIKLILNYIDIISVNKQAMAIPETVNVKIQTKRFIPVSALLLLVFFIFYLLFTILKKRIKEKKYSYLYFYVFGISKSFYAGLIIIFAIIISWFAVHDVRNYKDFRLIKTTNQPIVFSHKVHYTEYNIDCIYCHLDATKNTTANLPTIQICMKCHNYIEEGEEYGKTEIAKLYRLQKEKKEIQWKTGCRFDTDTHFDHQIHTSLVQIDCIDCHQNTEQPLILSSGFKMKFCINCHESSTVNSNNKYYIKQAKNNTGTSFSEFKKYGGTDCNTCHY